MSWKTSQYTGTVYGNYFMKLTGKIMLLRAQAMPLIVYAASISHVPRQFITDNYFMTLFCLMMMMMILVLIKRISSGSSMCCTIL